MNLKILLSGAAFAVFASACTNAPSDAPGAPDPKQASGTKPVTTGVVVRGLDIKAPPPPGKSGTSTGRDCDFSGEEVNQSGQMTGASVQCLAGGKLPQVLEHLPERFNSYCAVEASRLKGRLIPAPVPGNPEHCDLSAITRKDAQSAFGGAKWR